MIKLSSVRPSICVRLCGRNSYLEILPSWTFFSKRKITPAERHRTTSKNGRFCCRTRAPPSASLSQKSSYKTGSRTQLGARIRRIFLSRAVAYLPRSHQHRHPFYWPLFFSIVPSSSRKLMMVVWLHYSTIIQIRVADAGEAGEELEA